MNISLRQLRAFSAVAQLGSFAEAAKTLHVTAAALSILVRDLENEVGFKVFHRTTRRVELSEQGRQYLEYADRVLEEMRTAALMAEEICSHRTGLVRIAMTPLMHLTLLPPLFTAFQRQWPQVRIDLVDIASEQIVACVESGRADLAIAFDMQVGNELEASPLFASRLHAVLHPAHRLRDRSSVHWSDLRAERLIFISRGMELRVRSELSSEIALNIQYGANSAITAFALVASGAGVAIGPGYASPIGALHNLKMVPILRPAIDRRFMLYRRRSKIRTAAIETYAQFLIQHFASFKEGPVAPALPQGVVA